MAKRSFGRKYARDEARVPQREPTLLENMILSNVALASGLLMMPLLILAGYIAKS